jgi:hypothetical protein
MRAKISSIGDAPGSIIATIITHHIASISAAYPIVQTAGLMTMSRGMRVISSALTPTPAPNTIHAQDSAMTASRAAITTTWSRRSTVSSADNRAAAIVWPEPRLGSAEFLLVLLIRVD